MAERGSTYAAVAELPVAVEDLDLERRSVEVSSGFRRVTTTVVLRGQGHEGRGEDVTYTAEDHDDFPRPDLREARAVDALSAAVGALDLFGAAPAMEASRQYRRWAFESAGLDLALRQAGRTLGDVLGRLYRPVRFVVSTRLDPRAWLEVAPGLEFKLDATPEWDRALVAALAATGRVRVVDLKGYYVGTVVDTPVDADLYRLVAEGFPDAVIEDAVLDGRTEAALSGAEDRLSWDAPIHSWADIEALPVRPRHLNVKPSRFGSLRALLECVDAADAAGIALYGGGQFELGVGRAHIQGLAALLYPDGPNDVAPGVYNEGEPRPGLPQSPLPTPSPAAGIA